MGPLLEPGLRLAEEVMVPKLNPAHLGTQYGNQVRCPVHDAHVTPRL